MDSKDVITEMVENPKMIEDYKKFREIVKNFYPPSAIGLEDTMLKREEKGGNLIPVFPRLAEGYGSEVLYFNGELHRIWLL